MNNEFKYIRREEPELAFGIGKFIGIFEFMTQMSILMNISIGYFTSERFQELFLENYKWSQVNLLMLFVIMEHLLLGTKMFIAVQTRNSANYKLIYKERAKIEFRKSQDEIYTDRKEAYRHFEQKVNQLFGKKEEDDQKPNGKKKKRIVARDAEKLKKQEALAVAILKNNRRKHTKLKASEVKGIEYKTNKVNMSIFPDIHH